MGKQTEEKINKTNEILRENLIKITLNKTPEEL